MRRYRVYLFLSVLMLLLCHSQAYTYGTCKYNGYDIKWSNPTVTYYINTSGAPSGTITAVVAGMQTWTDVSPSDLNFVYGGTTSSTAHGVNNRTNIVTFGSLPVGVLAENYFWFTFTGSMRDSDIRFNTYYTWSTNGTPSTMDVQNIGTHEHGHSLCLVDLYNPSDSTKTMYGYGSYGETQKSTLHQDDIDGINYLYCGKPVNVVGGASYSTLQAAYDITLDGDVIFIQETTLPEYIYFDRISSVTLEGGYNCSYTSNPGYTAIDGTLTFDGDPVILDKIIIN
jgi:hypothetical protein